MHTYPIPVSRISTFNYLLHSNKPTPNNHSISFSCSANLTSDSTNKYSAKKKGEERERTRKRKQCRFFISSNSNSNPKSMNPQSAMYSFPPPPLGPLPLHFSLLHLFHNPTYHFSLPSHLNFHFTTLILTFFPLF